MIGISLVGLNYGFASAAIILIMIGLYVLFAKIEK